MSFNESVGTGLLVVSLCFLKRVASYVAQVWPQTNNTPVPVS